jgi:hypothetical protein
MGEGSHGAGKPPNLAGSATERPGRRKKRGQSPTARSLAYLREQGYLAEVVERRVPKCMILRDLFGFIDILAIRGDEVLGVQSTSRSNVDARIDKIAGHPNVGAVRQAGIRLEVHGWGRMASGRWELRVVDVS